MDKNKPGGNGSGLSPTKREVTDGELELAQHRRKKKIVKEFKDWKRTLTEMIRTGAQIVFGPAGQYQFLLPPALVKLVWNTTIQERIKFQQQQGLDPKEAMKKAIEGLQAEVDEAQEKVEAQQPQKPQLVNFVKLSQLVTAWGNLHKSMEQSLTEDKPITFQDLGRALEQAGVKTMNDGPAAQAAIEQYKQEALADEAAQQARAQTLAQRPSEPEKKELSAEEQAAEEAAAISLEKYREEMVRKSNE